MPELPTYRRHRTGNRDRALVELDGRRIYLGPYESIESRRRYDQVVAEWLANGRSLPPADVAGGPTVDELAERFLEHARRRYRGPDGSITSTVHNYASALAPLRRVYGTTPAGELGPRRLAVVRDAMLRASWCRRTINQSVNLIRAVYRWAVAQELVAEDVHASLRAVPALRRGEDQVLDRPRVRPVPDAHVDAIRAHVPGQVWAMVELQRLTGMRPGEVVIMRAADLDTAGEVWTYRPEHHKTEYRGDERAVYLGPRAQQLIRPFLNRDLGAYLFSPADDRPAGRRGRKPGAHYDRDSYRRAIARACTAAGVPAWSPNRLRHNAATRLRREYGIDVAQTILGHRLGSTITEIYADANVQKARAVMARVG